MADMTLAGMAPGLLGIVVAAAGYGFYRVEVYRRRAAASLVPTAVIEEISAKDFGDVFLSNAAVFHGGGVYKTDVEPFGPAGGGVGVPITPEDFKVRVAKTIADDGITGRR